MSTTQPRAPRPPLKVIGTELVKAKCGHPVEFPLFAPKQDRRREIRRNQITDRVCKPCRIEADKLQREAARKRRAELKKGAGPHSNHSRLPDGAEFNVAYDAATLSWSGTLVVNGKCFSGTRGGIYGLLRCLDMQFRRSEKD